MQKEGMEIENSDIEFIEGEFITVKQCTARSVEGGTVTLQQVGAFSIDGEKIEVTQGAAGILKGTDVSLNQSITGVAAADNVTVNFSCCPASISRDQTTVSRSAVGIMAARTIQSDNTSALLLVANKVEGNITTLLDWRSSLALGAVFGGLWGLFSILFRRK